MDVGLVCYGDIETNTGGFRYDRKLVEGLRKRGDRVEVVSLPWRDSTLRGLADGCSSHLCDRLDIAVDVLFEDELAHPTLVGCNRRLRARWRTRGRNVPVVAIVHHLRCSEARPAWRTRWHGAIERRYLAGIDAAICNSEATRESVLALAAPETTVVPPAGDRFDPAIDDATIAARAHEPGPLRVCFLGSLIPRKGLHTLVEGLSRVPDERWRLRVVGRPTDAEYTRQVERRTAELHLDGVSFAGELRDRELAAELERSHVVALPSTHEGFGIAYLEGMSFGLPALATAAGGARDIVSHGENGFLLSPDSPKMVARAVRALADDRSRLARMAIAARRRYETHPTWMESTDRVRAFLDELVTSHDGAGPSKTEARAEGAVR